jgi:hypothetical protein
VTFREIGGGVAFGVLGHAVLPSIIAADAPLLVLFPLALLPLVLNLAVGIMKERST